MGIATGRLQAIIEGRGYSAGLLFFPCDTSVAGLRVAGRQVVPEADIDTMFISNSGSFIFVHITKAAGTSVTAALDNTMRWNDLAIGGTALGELVLPHYQDRFGLHKHSFAREIRDVVGVGVWDDYFTFSLVRHPYSRAVSLYTFVQRTLRSAGYRRHLPLPWLRRAKFWQWPATRAFLASRDFAGFIRHPELLEHERGMRPQTDWLTDDDGRLIVDFVGKVEQMETDFAAIAARIGLDQADVGRHNISSRARWADVISREEDYRYLCELFRKDFDLLGYDPEIRA